MPNSGTKLRSHESIAHTCHIFRNIMLDMPEAWRTIDIPLFWSKKSISMYVSTMKSGLEIDLFTSSCATEELVLGTLRPLTQSRLCLPILRQWIKSSFIFPIHRWLESLKLSLMPYQHPTWANDIKSHTEGFLKIFSTSAFETNR